MTGPTPAELVRAALLDPCTPRRTRDGWITSIDLQLRTRLDARQVAAALHALEQADLLERTYGHPPRVRLTPARAQHQLTLDHGSAS